MIHAFSMDEANEINRTDRTLALVNAAAAAARLDEVVKHLKASAPETYIPGALRRESLAIASLEGTSVRKESLARLLGNKESTQADRSVMLAGDIHASLAVASSLTIGNASSAEIHELFTLSDTSAGRLMKPDIVWSLEDDSQWLVQYLQSTNLTSPFEAIEALRKIWTSGRFLGKSKRMTLLVAPSVLKIGFSCQTPLFGLAEAARRNIDDFREIAFDQEAWHTMVADVLSEAFRHERQHCDNVRALRTTLNSLCPHQRSSSSVGKAIDFIIGTPAFTAKTFAQAIDVSDRGGKEILDRLVDANVLEVEGGLRNRLFICRRAL